MSNARGGRREKEGDVESSLFSQLPKPPPLDEVAPSESFALFVGPPSCGKSSLLSLLQGGASSKEQPKPTVALEYVFARRSAKTGTSKEVAHIWELGGGSSRSLGKLVGVPVTPTRLPRVVLGIVLDLSKPPEALASLGHWSRTLRQHVQASLDSLKKTPDGNKVTEKLADTAKARFAVKSKKGAEKQAGEHPDRRVVDPFAVPLLIVCNKYDVFRDLEPMKKKALAQALRFVAHYNGATLVFSSTKDKALETSFRQMLSYALFHKTDKAAKVELSADKPLFVPAGSDTFAEIYAAGPIGKQLEGLLPLRKGGLSEEAMRPIQAAINDYFDYSASESKSDENEDPNTEAGANDPAFAEPLVDELYKQKMEALTRYRKKMEQKEKELDVKRRTAKSSAAEPKGAGSGESKG